MKRFLMYGIPKSLLIKIILFLLILLGAKNVFALEVDVSNNITSPNANGRKGTYLGTEIYNTGAQGNYNINTRYQGKLSRIIYNLPLPDDFGQQCFTTNVNYTITMNMATNDWNNAFGTVKVRPYSSSSTNWSNGSVTYHSYKKITFTFKIPSSDTTCYDFVWVDLPSTNISNTAITQISNWNLSKVTITDPTISSGGGSSGGTTPTPTPTNDYSSIINNQNENTNNIINNQNENTQQIIDNQNKNTESTNELLGDCHKNLFNINAYNNGTNGLVLRSDINGFALPGIVYSLNTNITLKEFCPECQVGKTYYLKGDSTSPNAKYIYLYGTSNTQWVYNSSKVLTQAMLNDVVLIYGVYPAGGGSGTIEISNIAMYEGTKNYTYSPFNEQVCTSKLDDTTQAINDLNDTLKDETEPTIDLDLDMTTNSPVSDLLTMPLTILNKVFDITDDSCQPYVLPFDFSGGNNTLTLPCINLQERLGNNVYNIIDTLLCFFIAYNIGLMCINIYENITSLRDGFDSLYTPQHAKPIGKHTSEVE